jgi:hypothetical protein
VFSRDKGQAQELLFSAGAFHENLYDRITAAAIALLVQDGKLSRGDLVRT